MSLVFPLLVPCRKWQDVKKNLSVGDICLMNFPNMKHDCYKLCRVLEVVFDGKGHVRTARVQYRRSDQRDKPEEYQEGRQFQEWVPVQRLGLLFSTAVPNDEVLVFVYRGLHSKYIEQSLLSAKCFEFTYFLHLFSTVDFLFLNCDDYKKDII